MTAVQHTFTRIAGHYDRLNRVLSCGRDMRWRIRAVGSLPNARRILDLACGTGDFTYVAAQRFPTAVLTGLDFTPAMLAQARTKYAALPCTWVEGDAGALPFADRDFDTVLCAFGFRNFPDIPKALAEVARVLAPGGHLLVLEFFRPRVSWIGRVVSLWIRVIARLFAPATQVDYAYLGSSIARAWTRDEFVAAAARCGLELTRETFFGPSCDSLLFAKVLKK